MNNSSKSLWIFTSLVLLSFAPSICLAWSGKVVSVTDGDTIKVLHNGKEEKIRLYGIDTPEKKQDFGQKAQDLTSSLVAGRNVEVQQKDVDRYGRIVGLVTVDGQSLNALIIQNGYAWVYNQFCQESFCSEWSRLETKAREQQKGMWIEANNIPPWEWRQQGGKKAEESNPQDIIIGQIAKAATVESPPAASEGKTDSRYVSSGTLPANNGQFKCDGRTYCSQMTSCGEATFFLKNCPGTKMDGDNDGIPCEKQWCK